MRQLLIVLSLMLLPLRAISQTNINFNGNQVTIEQGVTRVSHQESLYNDYSSNEVIVLKEEDFKIALQNVGQMKGERVETIWSFFYLPKDCNNYVLYIKKSEVTSKNISLLRLFIENKLYVTKFSYIGRMGYNEVRINGDNQGNFDYQMRNDWDTTMDFSNPGFLVIRNGPTGFNPRIHQGDPGYRMNYNKERFSANKEARIFFEKRVQIPPVVPSNKS